MKACGAILAFLAVVLPAYGQQSLVIRNAHVLTVTKGRFDGDVLIQDGTIAALGPHLAAPPGAVEIDAAGGYLMPGIIDCHSHIAADAVNEGSVSVSSMVRIEDVLNPTDIAIYRALAGGVTTAHVLHGSANTIGGTNAVIKLRWGKPARELLFAGAPPTLKIALGENVKRAGSSASPGLQADLRYPGTRLGVEDVLRAAFLEARDYQRKWREYEAAKAKGQDVLPPRPDYRLLPLVEVLEGKRLVHAHCYRADEILVILRVAQEFQFKIAALVHVLEGYKVAREIAAAGAGATTFSDWWSYKVEAYDAIPYNAAVLVRKGVLTSLNSDDAELMRHLNQEAAKTVKYGGLSEDEALALITINPARQLAIDRWVGSIETGKHADLVLYDKHPLSNYARPLKVFIDGRLYFDRAQEAAEREAQAKRKEDLLKQDRDRERAGAPDIRGERSPR